jgi:hypothetical protein
LGWSMFGLAGTACRMIMGPWIEERPGDREGDFSAVWNACPMELSSSSVSENSVSF